MSASQDLGTAATSRQALSVIFLGQNNLSSIAKRAFYAALAMNRTIEMNKNSFATF